MHTLLYNVTYLLDCRDIGEGAPRCDEENHKLECDCTQVSDDEPSYPRWAAAHTQYIW